MLFNPSEPNSEPLRSGLSLTGFGTGDCLAVPPRFKLEVAFTDYDEDGNIVNENGFRYYPAAEGTHILERQDIYPNVYKIGKKILNYGIDVLSVTVWEGNQNTIGEAWRFSYGWPWPLLLTANMEQQDVIDALGPTLASLLTNGLEIEPANIPLGLTLPPSPAWVLWYGPEYWRAENPANVNIVFPYYSKDELVGERNGYRANFTDTLNKFQAGNNFVGGIFQNVEFPDTLTLEPLW